jgi:dsRNA-specific ribonuclease
VFIATVSVDGTQLGEGTGRSKKDAEQGAAERAIETLSSGSR